MTGTAEVWRETFSTKPEFSKPVDSDISVRNFYTIDFAKVSSARFYGRCKSYLVENSAHKNLRYSGTLWRFALTFNQRVASAIARAKAFNTVMAFLRWPSQDQRQNGDNVAEPPAERRGG